MSRPEMRWHYHQSLVIREVIHRKNGGKPRMPDEVAMTDPDWDADLARMHTLFRFHEDYDKIPK